MESLPDADGERILQLTDSERLIAVGEHIANLIKATCMEKRSDSYEKLQKSSVESKANGGFAKLIELFEAIPNTIEITEDTDGKRILQLTDSERRLLKEVLEKLQKSSLKSKTSLEAEAPFSSGGSAQIQQIQLPSDLKSMFLHGLAAFGSSVMLTLGTEWACYLALYFLGFHSHGIADDYYASSFEERPDLFDGNFL